MTFTPSLTTTCIQNLISRCKEIPQGETNNYLRVFVRGTVQTRKSDFDKVPLFFRLTTETDQGLSILVRWIEDERISSLKTGKRSFAWINENLEEGCTVEVGGFLRHTKNGKPMLDAFDVNLISHSPDSEDLEETREMDEKEYESETSDDDYVPETDSEMDDDEDFRENVDEDDISDSESETEDSEPVRGVKISQDVTLTDEHLIFHGVRFEIMAFRTKPGRITIKSSLGNFRFDRMDEQYTSVLVPATDFEPSFKHGYTTLVKVPFGKILDVLF